MDEPGPSEREDAWRFASDRALDKAGGRWGGPLWCIKVEFPGVGPNRSSRQELSMLLVFLNWEFIVNSEPPFSSSSGQKDTCWNVANNFEMRFSIKFNQTPIEIILSQKICETKFSKISYSWLWNTWLVASCVRMTSSDCFKFIILNYLVFFK